MRLLTFTFFCMAMVGCRATPTQIPAFNERAGILIHVVGWDGPAKADRDFLNALRDGGCTMATETFDWTDGWRNIFALWRAQHSSLPARQLSARIESTWREHPERPISITADSSGCGVALTAIASLPTPIRIRNVILSSPAVSRNFDLQPALQHIDEHLISFNSDRDFVILCLGTTIFGTVDGHHADAAGRAGFVQPEDPCDAVKLLQIAYDPKWKAQYGNDGRHSKAMTPLFAKVMIAPLIH